MCSRALNLLQEFEWFLQAVEFERPFSDLLRDIGVFRLVKTLFFSELFLWGLFFG